MQAFPGTVLAVEPSATVRDVLEQLRSHNDGSVLVCREGKIAGIFTERDALRIMANGSSLDVPVEQLMISPPVTLLASDLIVTAINRMSSGGFRRLPIVDAEQRPVGMLLVAGLLHYMVQHFPEAVYNLPPQPKTQQQSREGS